MRATTLRLRASIVAAAIILSGCSAPPPPPDIGPATLVDLWSVKRVGAVQSWVRFDERFFALWTECGVLAGSWDAFGTSIAASIVDAFAGCFTPGAAETGEWIETVARFEVRPDGALALLDSENELVASLSAATRPPPSRGLQPELLTRPVLTEEGRERFAAPAGFPDQIDKVRDFVGVWTLIGDSRPGAFIVFKEDGEILGSDGCNQWAEGQYRYTGAGVFLASWLPQPPFDDCDNRVRLELFASVGTLDDSLLFYDAGGDQLAQFERLPSRSIDE